MKTKSLLFGCLAVFVLSLSACSQPAPVSDTASAIYSETDNLLYESETETVASVSTYVFAVTDASGRTVTDSKGGVVTAVETFPPAATTSTNPSALSRQTVVHTMPGAPSTGGTTARQPNSTTASCSKTTTASETTTTSRATTQQPLETLPQLKPTGSWYSPYDLPQIYAECKREIERLGLVWEDGLRPDSLGVSWDNPENTVVYTYYPEDFCLKDYVFNELIPFYEEQPYSRQACRIWLEPYEESPGDYLIYFLERR